MRPESKGIFIDFMRQRNVNTTQFVKVLTRF